VSPNGYGREEKRAFVSIWLVGHDAHLTRSVIMSPAKSWEFGHDEGEEGERATPATGEERGLASESAGNMSTL